MGLMSWLIGEKVLYYPGCVRNFVPQGRFAGGTPRWWDASLVGRLAPGRGSANWRTNL